MKETPTIIYDSSDFMAIRIQDLKKPSQGFTIEKQNASKGGDGREIT